MLNNEYKMAFVSIIDWKLVGETKGLESLVKKAKNGPLLLGKQVNILTSLTTKNQCPPLNLGLEKSVNFGR